MGRTEARSLASATWMLPLYGGRWRCCSARASRAARPLVVLPADAEADHPVALGDVTEDLALVMLRLVLGEVEDILRNLLNRLHVLGLARIASA